MKHSLPLATLTCLASLAGCATLPEDDVDQVEQPVVLGPNQPGTNPNPCLDGQANMTYTLATPLTSSATFQDIAASAPGGLAGCDYRVLEFRNVNGLQHTTGFHAAGTSTDEYPDMTEADCAASVFSGWVSVYHPPSHGTAGYWETIETLSNHHAQWRTWADGISTCNFDPGYEVLSTFTSGVLSGVTRLRVGSRLKIRHGGAWDRDLLRTHGYFTPAT